MALAVDASSPARFTGTPDDNVDITSASFTPPAGALGVVCISTNSNGQATLVSVSDSQGGTWTEQVRRNLTEAGFEGHASIWTRNSGLPNTSMTVSVRRTNDSGGTGAFDRVSAKAYVVTGQHATPVPTTGEGSSSTNNLTASIFTSAHTNSFAFVAATEWNANGLPTSSDLTIDAFNHAGVLSGLSGFKDLSTAGAETANLDAATTAAAEWNWAAIEVRANVDGDFTGALQAQASTIAGTFGPTVSLSGALAAAVADLDGAFFTSNEFTGALIAASASLSGTIDNPNVFSGALLADPAQFLAHFDVISPPAPVSDVRIKVFNDRRRFAFYLGPRRQ